MSNVCEIKTDGRNWYIPCEDVTKIEFIDGYLVNVSDHTINLKTSYGTSTTYPYATASSNNIFTVRTSNSSGAYHYITTDYKIVKGYVGNVILSSNLIIPLLLFIIVLYKIIRKWQKY